MNNKEMGKILKVIKSLRRPIEIDELAVKAGFAKKIMVAEYQYKDEVDFKGYIWDLLSDNELELTSDRKIKKK